MSIKVVPLIKPNESLSLILDTNLEQHSNIDLSQIDNEVLKLNDLMFDAYLWCISDRMKSIMDK